MAWRPSMQRAGAWLAGSLLLALAACTPQSATPPANQAEPQSTPRPVTLQALDGSEWRLVDGLDGIDLEAVTITLVVEAGRIGGNGGCNHYGADASEDAGVLSIGPVAATKRACIGPAGEAEAQYFRALDTIDSLSRDGDALLLRGSTHSLRFHPTATNPPPAAP